MQEHRWLSLHGRRKEVDHANAIEYSPGAERRWWVATFKTPARRLTTSI